MFGTVEKEEKASKKIFFLTILIIGASLAFAWHIVKYLKLEVIRMKIHITKQGDTLGTVASKHGVSQQDLLGVNTHINPTSDLIPGLKLKIPEATVRKEDASSMGHISQFYPNLEPSAAGAPPMQEGAAATPIGLKPFADQEAKEPVVAAHGAHAPHMAQSVTPMADGAGSMTFPHYTGGASENWSSLNPQPAGAATAWPPHGAGFAPPTPPADMRLIPPIYPPYPPYGYPYPYAGYGYGYPLPLPFPGYGFGGFGHGFGGFHGGFHGGGHGGHR